MNSKDYLEYKGSCLAECSMTSYAIAPGSDLFYALEKVLAPSWLGIPADPARNTGLFFREYLMYRFYITSRILRSDSAGLGRALPLRDGLQNTLCELSRTVRLSMGKAVLNGTYSRTPDEISGITPELLKERFSLYEEIDRNASYLKDKKEALAHGLTRSLTLAAKLARIVLDPAEMALLLKETASYRRFLLKEIRSYTPEKIHAEVRKIKISAGPHPAAAAGERLLYPACTLLAGMAAGILLLFA